MAAAAAAETSCEGANGPGGSPPPPRLARRAAAARAALFSCKLFARTRAFSLCVALKKKKVEEDKQTHFSVNSFAFCRQRVLSLSLSFSFFLPRRLLSFACRSKGKRVSPPLSEHRARQREPLQGKANRIRNGRNLRQCPVRFDVFRCLPPPPPPARRRLRSPVRRARREHEAPRRGGEAASGEGLGGGGRRGRMRRRRGGTLRPQQRQESSCAR